MIALHQTQKMVIFHLPKKNLGYLCSVANVRMALQKKKNEKNPTWYLTVCEFQSCNFLLKILSHILYVLYYLLVQCILKMAKLSASFLFSEIKVDSIFRLALHVNIWYECKLLRIQFSFYDPWRRYCCKTNYLVKNPPCVAKYNGLLKAKVYDGNHVLYLNPLRNEK